MEKERKKNKDKPSNPVFMRVFRFVFIIPYGHTHATFLIEHGANIKDVQERLGHDDITTTLNTYVHNTDNLRKETVDIFENAVKLNIS